jgi:hypothetical protein
MGCTDKRARARKRLFVRDQENVQGGATRQGAAGDLVIPFSGQRQLDGALACAALVTGKQAYYPRVQCSHKKFGFDSTAASCSVKQESGSRACLVVSFLPSTQSVDMFDSLLDFVRILPASFRDVM